jgi:prepilin-type processing-associated H-X9-DG protein
MQRLDTLVDLGRTRRCGFSLLDNLVTGTIVLIFVAIAIPAFNRARDNGQRRTCQTNLKQIGLGVMLYVRDYDEAYPPAVTGVPETSGAGVAKGWGDAIQPYVKSTEIYQCPAEPNDANPDPLSTGYSDYWYNCALSWNGKTGKAARWNGKVSQPKFVTPPSQVVMLGDGGEGNGSGTARTRSNGTTSTGSRTLSMPGMKPSAGGKVSGSGFAGGGQRHQAGLNIAFADGHVKWFRSTGPNQSAIITSINTPLSVSGKNPTFNVIKK